MEVESEDEDDHRDHRHEVHSSQPDQDTQLQDMDEVRAEQSKMFPFDNYCGGLSRSPEMNPGA